MDFVNQKQMASTLLSVHRFLPSQRRENIGYLSGIRTSLCGQVVLNPNFPGRQITGSHGNRFVVNSLFGIGKKAKSRVIRETVIPEPDYRIPIVLLGFAGGLVYTDNLVPGVPVGLLGLLLLFQTTRVRFVFDDEALEVKIGDQLDESGENAFVGGKNRWKYSTFVNWEFWWPNFPILVYFKETQTKPEGQIHFFPIIFNGKQLYDVMVERAGSSKTSAPKES
ncbi:unnamed protein product [Lathyrus oleraceus]|uniref:DUF3119 family protein n=1 Tax=Pisum sativum TaxID=3888 RepID=A0A9D4X9G4_PEA|nr:uncharacterized protein LOC127073559 [Pisum sativum]KAI5416253.1 hypothetical protein KIW84_041343 [Pisum sativum]